MREILFRGKRLDNGEWVEGTVAVFRDIRNELYTAIIPIYDEANEVSGIVSVDPKTVGQYTGLKDKNGRKIFEGDILSLRTGRAHEVKYTAGTFYMEGTAVPVQYANRLDVVGNVHDNRDLLEVEE